VGAEANRVQYHPAIAANEDGTESVSGPEEFDIDRLQSIRHTRALALNFMNEPVAQDGVYWSSETYRCGEPESVSRVMISIDPAVTTKRSSDFTGTAVVGYSPPHPAGGGTPRQGGQDVRNDPGVSAPHTFFWVNGGTPTAHVVVRNNDNRRIYHRRSRGG